MKAFLSIEINSPDLSKLSETTDEIFSPSFSNDESDEYKFVIAIGVGFTVPWLNVNSSALALINIKQKTIVKIYFIFNN